MASAETGQSRAAVLVDAARRSQFIAQIQKYEAKVKQEQKRRALKQREKQKTAMTLMEDNPLCWQSLDVPLLPIVQQVSMKDSATSRSNQYLEGGVLGNCTDIGCKDTEGDSRSASSSVEGTWEASGERDIDIAGLSLIETKASQHSHIVPKPSAPLDVNITTIAAALEIKIKKADMAAAMQEHAFRCARRCLKTTEKLASKHTAFTLKKLHRSSDIFPVWKRGSFYIGSKCGLGYGGSRNLTEFMDLLGIASLGGALGHT